MTTQLNMNLKLKVESMILKLLACFVFCNVKHITLYLGHISLNMNTQ